MVDIIYVARHGFRLNWVTNDWFNATNTARDPPLAAYGLTQAEEFAKHIESLPEDVRPTAIFSSPFYRCLQTATPTAKALGLPLYVEHGIMEWYSPVQPGTGLHPRPEEAHALQKHFPLIDPSYHSTWLPTRHGEDVHEVQRRTDDFLEAFYQRLAADQHPPGSHQRILFMGHAASCITLIKSLAGSRVDGVPLRIGTCSLTTLVREPTSGPSSPILGCYHVKGQLADGSFLTNGVERDWGFENITVDEHGTVVHDHGVPGSEGEEEGKVGLQIELPSPPARM